MGQWIGHGDFSSMRIDDGFAQCQTHSHATAAVNNFVGYSIKHLKNVRVGLGVNARPFVRHCNINKVPLAVPLDGAV